MKTIIALFALALSACSSAVDTQPAAIPDPDCGPGATDAKMVLTPEAVTSLDSTLASELGVSGCVEVANRGDYGNTGHMWCCTKLVSQ